MLPEVSNAHMTEFFGTPMKSEFKNFVSKELQLIKKVVDVIALPLK